MAQTIINISTPNDGLGDTLRHSFDLVNQMMTELYNNKVDKVSGMGLSSNDYTDAEQSKLSGIAAGAEVNVQADLLQNDNTQDDFIKNKESLTNIIETITDGVIGVTSGFTVGQTAFTIPNGQVATEVFLNGSIQYKITPNNAALANRWSQSGNVVTITKTTVLNNYILIKSR